MFSYKQGNAGYCVEKRMQQGKHRSREVVLEGLVQVRATSGSDQGGSTRGDENWPDFEHTLTAQPRRFTYAIYFHQKCHLIGRSQRGIAFAKNHCTGFKFYENKLSCFLICIYPITLSTVFCKFVEIHVDV